jgi:hypothetical protein
MPLTLCISIRAWRVWSNYCFTTDTKKMCVLQTLQKQDVATTAHASVVKELQCVKETLAREAHSMSLDVQQAQAELAAAIVSVEEQNAAAAGTLFALCCFRQLLLLAGCLVIAYTAVASLITRSHTPFGRFSPCVAVAQYRLSVWFHRESLSVAGRRRKDAETNKPDSHS